MSISTNSNLVSVIIATYNRRDFIVDAIESVIAQSYKDWELIIIDDGSTDDTKDIIEKHLESEKISYYYQNNQKQASALNTGLKYAHGDWIAFLDSDNKWLSDRLELGINCILSNPDMGLIYGDIYTINEAGVRVSEKNMKRYTGNVTARLLFDNFISFNTTLIRKDILEKIGGFNADLDRAPDYDCWLRASTITKFLYISEYLAEYRVMDNQISSDKTSRFDNNEKTLKRFLYNYPNAVTMMEKKKGLSAFYLRKAYYLKANGSFLLSISTLTKSLGEYPFWLRPWKFLLRLLVLR